MVVSWCIVFFFAQCTYEDWNIRGSDHNRKARNTFKTKHSSNMNRQSTLPPTSFQYDLCFHCAKMPLSTR